MSQLKITLIRSGINRPAKQKQTVQGLGLTKLHQTKMLNDTPAIRGMIRKVSHLLHVEVVK